MTLTIALCWLVLLLPGFAIVRRWAPGELESGLLGSVAACAIATLGLLTPVSILAFLVGAPLVVLSSAAVAAVAAALVVIIRRGWWRDVGALLLTGVALEMIVVAIDLVLGGRVGTMLGADAMIHVGRIRFLMDQGLLNADHFVAADGFYPVYHTNILHALLAMVGQLTGSDAVEVWYGSLPVAKLLVVSGGAYAAWAIFRSGWAAWATALFLLGHRAPVTFMLYPNQLSPWFLMPMLIAVIARVYQDRERAAVVGVALVTVILGQVHAMYAAFGLLAVGPVLAAGALIGLVRRAPERRLLVACGFAAILALPFPAISHLAMRQSRGSDRPALVEAVTATDAGDQQLSRLVRKLDNGWVMLRIGRGFTGGRGFRVPWIVVAAALALVGPRRRSAAVLLGVLATVALLLYVPPLCTRLLALLGTEWMLQRFATFQDVCFALLVPGAVAAFAEHAVLHVRGERRSRRVAAPVIRGALAAIAVYSGAHCAALRRPYDYATYLDRASAPRGYRRGGTVRPLVRLGEDLRAHMPPGSVVLADESLGMRAVMVHDCRIILPSRSTVGIDDVTERRADLRKLLKGATPAADRAALLERYAVTHVLSQRPAPDWTVNLARDYRLIEGDHCLVALRRPDDPPDLRVTGQFAIALIDAGRGEEALDYLDGWPAGFRNRFRLANALYDAGRFDVAVQAFEQAAELRPKDPRPRIMIGNALAALERLEEAACVFEELIALASTTTNDDATASAWFNLGNMRYRQERWDDAVAAYEEALALSPGHLQAREWLDKAHAEASSPQPGGGAEDGAP